ncbi:hypothetical protein GF327_04365 [Candidatus Woesearchaeota archaeon]|nr:hypothetical protein [Candidatus Woesearchaeota archaeon]
MIQKIQLTSEECCFCAKKAITKTSQGFNSCNSHKNIKLNRPECICGGSLKKSGDEEVFNCDLCHKQWTTDVLFAQEKIALKEHHTNKLTFEKINKSKDLISDVSCDKLFYCSDGTILKNLDELCRYMKDITKNVFYYHVKDSKNDFADWVELVINDKRLAKNLRKHNNSKAMYKTLKNRNDRLNTRAK